MIPREQLELVIQKKKINEVYNWFQEHFVTSSRRDYISRCPFLIIQGPTGCGKTSTLKCIARELKIPVREYSDTTDITHITYDLAHPYDDDERANLSLAINKRKANKFEHFVVNNIRFNPLYPVEDVSQLASADSEFESDDDFPLAKPPPPPTGGGVIIHIEGPLSFTKSRIVLIQSINRLSKLIKDLSKVVPRRVAIIFENDEREVIYLPTKYKTTLGIHTIKFNPITRANMKRFLENLLKKNKNLIIDKDTIDLLVNDCDGDMRACMNTVELLRNSSQNFNNVFMGMNNDDLIQLHGLQVSKKQRLNPGMSRVQICPTLMRDITKSLGFFHILGKIFYQKRLYPEKVLPNGKRPRSTDRPYPTENSTEYLVDRLDLNPKDLNAWLHQHYYKFCHEFNIEKASMFLENLSDADTISIDSTQSSQFYETHNNLDQLQLHISIESTVFSLYEDQANATKPSHKKILTNRGNCIVKSSIENFSGNGDLYSFNKPASLSVPKVSGDNQKLLNFLVSEMMRHNSTCLDPTKLLVDFIPYLNHMSRNWTMLSKTSQINNYNNSKPCLLDDILMMKISKTLESSEQDSKLDFDSRHEGLLEIIEEIEEVTTKVKITGETVQD